MTPQTYGASGTAAEHDLRVEHEPVVRQPLTRVYSNGEPSGVEDLIEPEYVGYNAATHDVYLGRNGVKL